MNNAFEVRLESVLNMMDSKPDEAIAELETIINDAEVEDLRYYQGKAKWYKAYIYDRVLEDISYGYHFYNEALKDVLVTDDSSLKMKIYNNLGILYRCIIRKSGEGIYHVIGVRRTNQL